MKPPNLKHIKYYIISLFVFYIFWGHPVEFGKEKSIFQGFKIQKPIIRIGLGVNLSDIKIRSSSGMKIYEVKSNYKLVADDVSEVNIRGRKEKISEKFIIQVAQSKEREEAELKAQDLRTEIEAKVYVTENKDNGTFQVMVGDFLTRDDALKFIKTLNEIGIVDTWIIREEITEETARPLWILVNNELKSLDSETVLYFIPSHKQSFLSFKGRAYRGIFVLRASPKGIVLVNILNLENYLKGVVPSEFSPYSFAEIEAHKAQAVAARTYAIKNLGTYENLGFDLDDTPKTQFYRGMSAEHPLSTEAVEKTRGEVIVYRGKLINALYTSTCGGRTEDVENIFVGQSHPYLRSTECLYEKQKEWLLESKNIFLPIKARWKNISREIAYLTIWNVIPNETNPAFYRGEATLEEAVNWTRKALILLGKKNEIAVPQNSVLNFINFAHLIIDAFGWQNRVENLLLESEVDYILKDFEGLKEEDRTNLAYLILRGIFPASKDTGNKERRLTRAEAAFYLAKVILSYKDLYEEGMFIGFRKDMIELENGNERELFAISPNAFILRNNDDQYSFASRVYLLGGEELRWVERGGEIKLLEIIYPPNTNTLDRHSIFNRWHRKKSQEELERVVTRYYPIGKLIDIIPLKRGASKRVIELLIRGTEGQAVVTGLKIRWVLGLRDTLFVIDREYDGEGNIVNFTFSGRGWGHGVGLCQVGAYGMAQTGATYKEILKKYYYKTKIKKIF